MSKFLKKLNSKFCLLVSLTENDPHLAEIAQNCGADAIKVHLNVKHRASNVLFGSWSKEKKKILKIFKAVNIPIGIVPGAEVTANFKEMLEMEELGIDFWDIFIHHLPTYLFKLKMGKMTALDNQYPLNFAHYLKDIGINAIEGSIIPPEEYGKKLNARDLIFYYHLIKNLNLPLIIPTQRKIELEDLFYLKKIGASGIGIGAVVTGKEKNKIKKVISDFSRKIKELNALNS
ncbi:MAG: hypothetical protein HYU63_02080 [Armatimonadetes bacterium]|nr:hypothetical protein [Armatimonadota bacterium]